MNRLPGAMLATALVPLALTACEQADGGWQGTVRDSAGVEVVTNAGGGSWTDDSAWTVEEDLVIGASDGDPDYQFGQIAGIDVGSDGRIYVMDQQASEVRVFSPEGEFQLSMGQRGAGPGELSQGAGPLFVGPGDTITIPDLMQQRITRYTSTGESAGSHPLPMTDGIATRWMEAPDQTLLQQAVIMQMPGQADVEPKNLLLRRHPSGSIQDTVLEMPVSTTVDFSGGQPRITLFEPEAMWSIGPDGRLYSGVNSEYRLEVRSPDGELERIIAKDAERRPVTETDETEYRRIIRGLWEDQGMPPEALQAMTQGLGFADYYPAYANIMGGPDGTLWVQGIQTPDEIVEQGGVFDMQDMGSATWEVFSPQGRFMGTVQMPPRFTPFIFQDNAMYGILLDDLDVQYVARMMINRGETAAGD